MKRLLLFILTLNTGTIVSQTSWATFVLQDSICEGNTASLVSNSGTVSVTGYTWNASPLGLLISSQNSASTSINFSSAGIYTVSLSAASGTSTSYYTDTIVVLPSPTVNISGPTNPICPPPTSMGGLYMTGSGATSYTWFPGAFTGATYWQMQPSTSTTFTLIGKDSYGCSASATHYVQVLPQVYISVSAPSIACDGSMVCFTESGFDLVHWVWDDGCGTQVSGSPYACFTASLACGNTYTVGGNNGTCMNYITFSVNISPCTDVDQITLNNTSFELYPSPFTHQFSIKASTGVNENIGIEIYEIAGKLVKEDRCYFDKTGNCNVNAAELSPGIYFIMLKSGEKYSRPHKIIKE